MGKLEYLSEDWFKEFAKEASKYSGSESTKTDSTLVVEYRVISEPPVIWHITFDKNEMVVRSGPATEPDVLFEAKLDTARAIFTGHVDPLRAAIEGDVTMGGDPRQLLRTKPNFDGIGDIFAPVRDATSASGS